MTSVARSERPGRGGPLRSDSKSTGERWRNGLGWTSVQRSARAWRRRSTTESHGGFATSALKRRLISAAAKGPSLPVSALPAPCPVADIRHEIDWRDARIEKLTFDLKRIKFGKKSEQLDAEQRALFDQADIAAIEDQPDELRAALPSCLPRVVCWHEPESTTCACGCVLTSART